MESEDIYKELKTELGDTILELEVNIINIRDEFENTRLESLTSMKELQERSKYYLWFFNIFVLLLLGITIALLWFPRKIVNLLSLVTHYLANLNDDTLHIPLEIPQKLKYSSKNELAKLTESIEWMRQNLVSARAHHLELIERLKEARLKAQAAGAAKDEFLSVISHELRTPLNPIIGFSDYLKNQIEDPELKGHLSIIDESARKLGEIIDNILEYTSINKQVIESHPETFDYVHTCQAVAASIRQKYKTKKIEWKQSHEQVGTNDPDVNIPFIVSDPTKLKQILLILIDNAFKFTSEGSVRLTTTLNYNPSAESSLTVAIRDTGIGISEEKLDGLFDPFFQEDSSMTRQYGGIGLGLAICDMLVKGLGGKIEFETKLGKGSEFRFEIPVKCVKQTMNMKNPAIAFSGASVN